MSNNVVIIVADEVPVGTLLAVAKRAGTDVKAVVAGSRALADTVAAGGVASVAWTDVPEATPAEAFAGTVAEAVKALEPGVVLAPNAAASRVLAGAVAAQLDAAVASSVSSIAFEGDVKVVDRLVAEQRAVETLETTAPVVALVADGSDDVEATAAAPVEAVAGGAVAALTITATHAGEEGGASLASANRVLGVGRGLTSKDQLALAEALAAALDAEIACSLSLCDDYRWFEHSRVVGTSTQRIAPAPAYDRRARCQDHRRDQQRSRGAHFPRLRLRHRRRLEQGGSCAHGGAFLNQGSTASRPGVPTHKKREGEEHGVRY